jgi:hypothetical protein
MKILVDIRNFESIAAIGCVVVTADKLLPVSLTPMIKLLQDIINSMTSAINL